MLCSMLKERLLSWAPVFIYEVELDLHPRLRVIGIKVRLTQHPREYVETQPHLLAKPRAISPGELLSMDILSHANTLLPSGDAVSRKWFVVTMLMRQSDLLGLHS